MSALDVLIQEQIKDLKTTLHQGNCGFWKCAVSPNNGTLSISRYKCDLFRICDTCLKIRANRYKAVVYQKMEYDRPFYFTTNASENVQRLARHAEWYLRLPTEKDGIVIVCNLPLSELKKIVSFGDLNDTFFRTPKHSRISGTLRVSQNSKHKKSDSTRTKHCISFLVVRKEMLPTMLVKKAYDIAIQETSNVDIRNVIDTISDVIQEMRLILDKDDVKSVLQTKIRYLNNADIRWEK